jgi:hypothetical protein
MSHFSVNVIIPKFIFEGKKIYPTLVEDYINCLMRPFDEGIVLPRYIKYTKEEWIKSGRDYIQEYADSYYAEYLQDPIKYSAENGLRRVNYVSNEFPKKLNWTDEEVYADVIKHCDPDEISPDGGLYDTRNPNSKWDWFKVGGRFAGWLQDRDKELASDDGFNFHSSESIDDNSLSIKEAIDKKKIPFAILTPMGEWIERGKMGW